MILRIYCHCLSIGWWCQWILLDSGNGYLHWRSGLSKEAKAEGCWLGIRGGLGLLFHCRLWIRRFKALGWWSGRLWGMCLRQRNQTMWLRSLLMKGLRFYYGLCECLTCHRLLPSGKERLSGCGSQVSTELALQSVESSHFLYWIVYHQLHSILLELHWSSLLRYTTNSIEDTCNYHVRVYLFMSGTYYLYSQVLTTISHHSWLEELQWGLPCL